MTKQFHILHEVALFKNGRESIEEDPRSSRPIIQGLPKTTLKPKSKDRVFIHFLVNEEAINTRSYNRNCFGPLNS